MNEILTLLTSTMSIHLNSGQRLIINSPNMFIYMSMEMISAEGLLNKKIQLRVCSENYGHYSIKMKMKFVFKPILIITSPMNMSVH